MFLQGSSKEEEDGGKRLLLAVAVVVQVRKEEEERRMVDWNQLVKKVVRKPWCKIAKKGRERKL
jgi:hypothetical protein